MPSGLQPYSKATTGALSIFWCYLTREPARKLTRWHFEITVEVQPDHVVLRPTGTFTVESALDLLAEEFATAEHERVKAALIDGRFRACRPGWNASRSEPSSRITGILLFDSQWGATPIVVGLASFTEGVASHRGRRFRAFSDMQEAGAWLTQAG